MSFEEWEGLINHLRETIVADDATPWIQYVLDLDCEVKITYKINPN